MKLSNICLGCMSNKAEARVCPYCGYPEGEPAAAPHYLPPGSMLAGKYLVGRGLGHGGFGVTYIAYDVVLNIKMAIKEYLPQDCAGRNPGQTKVVPFTGEGEKRFKQGLESFLQEARTLAVFDGQPGIVGVRDFFTENGTAYLVMNYLEGITLKDVLVKSGGAPMPYDKLIKIMLPVMHALEKVHAAGLLHRDVSPDNIFLTTQGQVVLIDFGAARQSMSQNRSMSVILKPGYAPEEQYKSRGNQGPWTDVYALGACMYRALTGRIPQESLERLTNDRLAPPSRYGISLPQSAEAALMRAMAVRPEQRFGSVAEFRRALTGAAGTRAPSQGPRPAQPQRTQTNKGKDGTTMDSKNRNGQQGYPLKAKKKKGMKGGIIIAIVLVALLVGATIFVVNMVQSAMNDGGDLPSFENSAAPSLAAGEGDTPPASLAPVTSDAPADTPVTAPTPTLDPDYTGPAEQHPGAVPTLPIAQYVPTAYQYIEQEGGEISESWLTGLRSTSVPDALAVRFIYFKDEDMVGGGDVFYYKLDESGNLIYGAGLNENNYKVLIPAVCAVGTEFEGVYGPSRVAAVNVNATVGTTKVENAIVIYAPGEDYMYFVPGVGHVASAEQIGGEVTMESKIEAAQQSLFEKYVMP